MQEGFFVSETFRLLFKPLIQLLFSFFMNVLHLNKVKPASHESN